MRVGILWHKAGAVGGHDLRIVDVRSSFWRELWFRSTPAGGGDYLLECFATRADLEAATNRVASKVHGPSVGSSALDVTLDLDVGAPFDPTPLVVSIHAQGTWTEAWIAWTHNPTGLLISRAASLLEQYRAPSEMLSRALEIRTGHLVPSALLPCVGVTSGAVVLGDGVGAQLLAHEVQVELHAWVAELSNTDAYLEATEFGSALVAIAEEQREWGGMSADTRVVSPAQIAIEDPEGGGRLYHAIVVVAVAFSSLVGTRDALSDTYATGGKYAAAVA